MSAPFSRQLTDSLRQLVRRGRARLAKGRYGARIAAEVSRFRDDTDIHALPPIFHYWSNRYLRPKLESHGFSHPDAFFAVNIEACCARAASATQDRRNMRIISLGAGNCDTEVRLARALLDGGRSDFVIECLDLNDAMLDRGRALAADQSVTPHIAAVRGDFNAWQPDKSYDCIIANQSLHHVLALEHLFSAVATGLAPHARFVVSDIIGRNGHQRWPEARAIVEEFWSELPTSHRYHRQLRRQEDQFLDWDCSISGFEGIRAQDILPLLVERFTFDLFIGFANVIDPFVDRGFGPNFSTDSAWDKGFIDRVHDRDEAEMNAGRIKPAHMFAVMRPAVDTDEETEATSAARAAVRRPD
jgi:SAM-dependent methyltransferase